ncbi:uncharacterized protein MONBRDRAFT_34266 [Monosiga brevicollis MX1]|uniref:R3H domain-containing protein n=1 Tax=Monosiga brevicollis TaxID=81824 RepID=A9VAL0_MONBE|nr:uncharacterized protein MONBRDRAFT_34266 [Monosiga brevicollis MX1]EDQ85392.1 predicted protein [Monosiga brevicollis MX1]|eukprot:XP_001749803.1 hypothetical protein [Monosiga brevicollis MX1]
MEAPDFYESYRAIQGRLKKRFMRRPNHGEAALSFHELQGQLAEEGKNSYAAFCALAAARCEAAVKQHDKEADTLVKAGQLMFTAEAADRAHLTVTDESDYQDGVNCYLLAIQLYIQLGLAAYATTLCIELAHVMKIFSHLEDAVRYYLKASDMLTESPLMTIQCLFDALECELRLKWYRRAANSVVHIVHTVVSMFDSNASTEDGDPFLLAGRLATYGAARQVAIDAEVTALLLMFCLHLTDPDQATIFRGLRLRYTSLSMSPIAQHLDVNLELQLRHLVMALAEDDAESIQQAQLDVYPRLNAMQRDLLHELLVLKGIDQLA